MKNVNGRNDPMLDTDAPVWRRFEFYVQVQEADATCMSLLSQVMAEFKQLPLTHQAAIARWFLARYEDTMPPGTT